MLSIFPASKRQRRLTRAVDEFERAGAGSGHLETGLVDAETVAALRVALDGLEIADRVAVGNGDLHVGQTQGACPLHRLDALTFTG